MSNQQPWLLKFILPLTLLLAAIAAIWLPLPMAVRLVAAALLTAFLPGYYLLQAIGWPVEDRLTQLVLAIGGSFGLTIVGSLGLLYLAGSLSTTLIVLGLVLICLVLMVIGLRRSTPGRLAERADLYFFIPVAVAAFFSLTGLGYADYWGDEMNGLLRAISIIGGRAETIFEHTKGPVEILLPAVFGLLAGSFDPFTLRFPFALAYIAGVGGFFLLVRGLFNRYVALLASLILALNGLYLAFGRLVQYQAVVFVMTGLALLLAWRFYRTGAANALGLSLFLVGVGLLAHYDMLLALPPLAYLIWRRFGWQGPAWRRAWPQLAASALILAVVTAGFYLPFWLHPHAETTSAYLARRISASGLVSNNFDQLYMFAVMYNSSYYVAFITLLGLGYLGVELARLGRARSANRKIRLTLAVALILILGAALAGQVSLIPLLITLLLLGLLVGFSAASVELKMIYLWVGVSFIGYVFLVDYPRTHLRIIYPGWSVLAALALVEGEAAVRRKLPGSTQRWLTAGAIIALGVLLLLFAGYQYLLFVDVEREYIFTYPQHKNSLYWEDDNFPFGSRRLYGAPHRLGWQMVNQLYRQGGLQGDWDSNDHGANLFWYTLGAPRQPCYPRYYFLTEFEQKDSEGDPPPNLAEMGYGLIGQVWNRDRRQLEIYELAPAGSDRELTIWAEPSTYRPNLMPQDFETWPYEQHQATIEEVAQPLSPPPTFKPSPAALAEIANHYQDPRIKQVRDSVALVGYQLDQRWQKPGGAILLTLYWQAVEVVNLPYKIFTHLENNAGELWSQADDLPACGSRPTQRWRVGEIVADRHLLKLPANLPPGDYRIQVGLYEPETGLRMDRLDSLGNPQGVSFELTTVTIPAAN